MPCIIERHGADGGINPTSIIHLVKLSPTEDAKASSALLKITDFIGALGV